MNQTKFVFRVCRRALGSLAAVAIAASAVACSSEQNLGDRPPPGAVVSLANASYSKDLQVMAPNSHWLVTFQLTNQAQSPVELRSISVDIGTWHVDGTVTDTCRTDYGYGGELPWARTSQGGTAVVHMDIRGGEHDSHVISDASAYFACQHAEAGESALRFGFAQQSASPDPAFNGPITLKLSGINTGDASPWTATATATM